jgi:hypothetical protein
VSRRYGRFTHLPQALQSSPSCRSRLGALLCIHPTRFQIVKTGVANNGFGLSVNRHSVQGWVSASSLVRRAAEAVRQAVGRRHLAQLELRAPARCQTRILLGLLHQAQSTRFGRDHDFRRIRTLADYRRLVPLSTRAELWRDYWRPVYPHLEGATWPGRRGSGVLDSDDSLRLRPPSVALQAAHRAALRTALALADQERSGVAAARRPRLLSGVLLFLTDEAPSSRTEHAILAERLPALIRPFTVVSADIEAERFARLPVTGLIGPAERLLSLFEAIKLVGGKRCLRDIWPRLSTILYTRRPSHPPATRLCAEAGQDVVLLEMIGRAEGPIAVEDPRFGSSKLLFDHGVFFEFVPVDRADEPRCPRYGIDEIEVGVPYELAVTSPAGLWACRIGRTVCLERRDPPLLRFVETAIQQAEAIEVRRPSRRTDLILSTPPLPPPHLQNADNPAARPETTSRSPWSILADRE